MAEVTVQLTIDTPGSLGMPFPTITLPDMMTPEDQATLVATESDADVAVLLQGTNERIPMIIQPTYSALRDHLIEHHKYDRRVVPE
jgi:hypothetical protein